MAHIIPLPKWILIIRGFQFLLAIILLGISAYGIYWVAFAAWSFTLFTTLATFLIILYITLSSQLSSLHALYNPWAQLGLEIFMIIFWLSAMAALAATRATFTIPTEINGCVNYGYGGVCYRDVLEKRAVATYGYLDMMSAAAGLSAIELILFITTLTVFSIHLRRGRAPNPRIVGGGVVGNDKLDTDTEALPMNPVAYDPPMPYQGQGQGQGYGEGYGGQQQYSDQPIAVAPPQQQQQQYHEVQGQGQ